MASYQFEIASPYTPKRLKLKAFFVFERYSGRARVHCAIAKGFFSLHSSKAIAAIALLHCSEGVQRVHIKLFRVVSSNLIFYLFNDFNSEPNMYQKLECHLVIRFITIFPWFKPDFIMKVVLEKRAVFFSRWRREWVIGQALPLGEKILLYDRGSAAQAT